MPPDHRKALSGQDDASPWIDWLNRTQAGLVPRQANRLVQGAAALALLAGTALAPPAQAQGAPAAPPVTVATPLARQVAEWDEHTARIEPSARVEIRPRVSGQVMQVHFQDGAPGPRRRAAVHAGPAALPDRGGDRPRRGRPQRGPAHPRRAAGAALHAAGAAAFRAGVRDGHAAQRARARRRPASPPPAPHCTRRSSTSNSPEIRAPRPGRVSDRRVDAGNLVQQGATLLTTLVALDPIYVSFDASEAEYLRYARAAQGGMRRGGGQAETVVQLRAAGRTRFPPRRPHGLRRQRLRRPQRHDPRPRRGAEPGPLPDARQLRPLRLFAGEAPALMVPDAAVMADQSGRMVLTVGPDGTVAPRTVQLGPLVDGLRVVRSGPGPGGPGDHRRAAPRPPGRPGHRASWAASGPARWPPPNSRLRPIAPREPRHAPRPLLHRPPDLRRGALHRHHPARRHRRLAAADRRVPGDHAADRAGDRLLSRRQRRGRRRHRRRARSSSRSTASRTCCTCRRNRPATARYDHA